MVWIIVLGLIIGIVAKFFMPGKDPGGIIITTLLGIGGAVLASWAGSAFGHYQYGEPVGFITAVLGAMVILMIYRWASVSKQLKR